MQYVISAQKCKSWKYMYHIFYKVKQIDEKAKENGFGTLAKVIYTKYSKHEPYTVAHIFDYVCSKINNSWFNPWFSFYFLSLYNAPYIEWYMC